MQGTASGRFLEDPDFLEGSCRLGNKGVTSPDGHF